MPNTAMQGYQEMVFPRGNFPTSPLQQLYQIKGSSIEQPNAILQPGDISYCNNEYDLDLEYLFSCNVEFFEQPGLAVCNDQRDSILESPSSSMTNEYTPNVKGRLKENISFWEEIGASSWLLSILRESYALPFISEPKPKIFQNNVSALRNKEFVTNEILDLLSSGRVREVSQNEIKMLNPLTVADNGQTLRLILDRRHINSFLRVPKFKCDDIHTIRDLFEVGDYFFKFDIKSGYHHIDILEVHQKYLGFSWEFDGKIRYFVFTVLVFGLATAPFVFTKVVCVLIKHWHTLAIRIFAFIDDVFGGGSSFKEALNFSNIVRRDLLKSGFVAHPIKSE